MKIFIPNILLISLLLINKHIRINCKPTLNSNVYDSSFEIYDYYHKIAKNENTSEKEEVYFNFDITSNKTIEEGNKILVKKSNSALQSVNYIKYEETLSEVNNPYRGFYEQAYISIKRNISKSSCEVPSSSLVRLLIDISDFQKDDLSDDSIIYLNNIFSNLKANHQTAVVRFSYHKNFNDTYKTTEPDISRVLKHLDKMKTTLNNYDDTIASVECGLFGAYGEMYKSDVTEIQSNKRNFINSSIQKWLEILNETITVSVRTPEQYINFYEDILNIKISDISEHKPSSSEPGYRIGIFNDGYFSSSDDIGTYENRDKGIKWLSNQATHTLFGGEFGNYTQYNMGNIIIDCIHISTEAFKTHTSYLNSGYYEGTLNILKNYSTCIGPFDIYNNQTAYKYIENHLGYRYVVRNVRLTTEAESNGIFGAEISIENVGFANLIKPKSIYVIMKDSNNNLYDLTNSLKISNNDPRQWWSKAIAVINIEGKLPGEMPNGNYKLYLRIASNSNGGLDGYPIRFANDDEFIWNEPLGANYLGEFAIVGHYENPLEINTNVNIQENMIPFNSKYIAVKFKGTLDYTENYYLGVPELKEIDNFNIYELTDTKSAKHHTWYVDSEISPSLLYLSNGISGNIGEPSEYCLDLGTFTDGNGYNFLSIVKCSNAKHKFMYGKSYLNSIDVYDLNNNHLTDSNRNDLCLFYSMTPKLDKCSLSSSEKNMSWEKVNIYPEYTTVKFKGMLNNDHNKYLGVPELKEYNKLDISNTNDSTSAKYRTWHVSNEETPSLLYLSNGTFGNNGEPTNYCLDLSTSLSNQGYNYLSIVECSKAQYRFMFGGSLNNSLDVYKKNGDHLTDKDGDYVCLYYSVSPSINKCNNSENDVNMHWKKYVLTTTYTPIRFKGTLTDTTNYYLGVPELKEHNNFNIYELNDIDSAKYHTWQIISDNSPSLLYLSDGANDDIGEPTNYCLDLGTYTNDKGYNFLSVVDCSKAQHKFLYDDSFSNSIGVYKRDGDPLTNENGVNLCLYYSMTPCLDECELNVENMKWDKYTYKTTYIPMRFKGTLTDTTNFYLGVPELKEHNNFNIYELNDTESAKYRTWQVISDNSPSLLYLSDGANDDIGEPTNYCLDLGTYTNDKGYNFLSVVDCSKAQHKFQYGGSFSNSIEVYNIDGNPLTNTNGVNLCLYYSMTPCLDECNLNIENMKWDQDSFKPTYIPMKFKGTLTDTTNYYLGVPELKEHNNFNIYELNDTESAKYHTWQVISDNSPSLLYLSDGANDDIGEPTNYCLDLGTYTNDKGYNFLSVVDCSKAQHKFMYGGSFSNSIEVYNIDGNPLTNTNGVNLCLYYSMTPCLDECNLNIENMKWDKY